MTTQPKNFTLRSFSKFCRQLEGSLHMITFDYRTVLHLYSSISFWLQRNWANELNVTDHFHSCKRRSWGLVAFISLRASSPIWASEASLARTRERGAGPSRLRRSLTRSRAARFARPNRRACSQAKPLLARLSRAQRSIMGKKMK